MKPKKKIKEIKKSVKGILNYGWADRNQVVLCVCVDKKDAKILGKRIISVKITPINK